MSLYAGLSPTDALAKWAAIRKKPVSQQTAEEKADIAGNMTGLAAENPAAWQAVKTGVNDNGDSKQIFNQSTGQWETQQDQGFWSHPESWLQLGFGGALGGIGAASVFGGAAAAPATTSGGIVTAQGPLLPGEVAASGAASSLSPALGAGGASLAAPAAAGGASLWKTLAAPAIGAGTQIAGSLINANQQDKATQAQLQANAAAQAFLKEKYANSQRQVAPFVAEGQGALAMLGSGLGITLPSTAAQVDPSVGPFIPMPNSGQTTTGKAPAWAVQAALNGPAPNQPWTGPVSAQPNPMPQQTQAPNSTQSLSQSSVRLQSPDGSEVQSVPSSQAQYYISKGAKVVQ